jgi:transketolase
VQEVEPIAERVRCFGWRVHEVDGHDSDALAAPASEPSHGKPLFVIARTCSWRGIPSLEARANKHYVRFRPGEAELALSELHLSAEGARS